MADALAEIHDHGLTLDGVRRGDIGLDASDRAVLLAGGAERSSPAGRQSDLRSLAGIGLELLAESGDVDSSLQQLLETVAFGESADLDAAAFADRLRPTGVDGVLGPGPDQDRGSIRNATVRNPYKGLLPFDLGDADDFFGRKDVIARTRHPN